MIAGNHRDPNSRPRHHAPGNGVVAKRQHRSMRTPAASKAASARRAPRTLTRNSGAVAANEFCCDVRGESGGALLARAQLEIAAPPPYRLHRRRRPTGHAATRSQRDAAASPQLQQRTDRFQPGRECMHTSPGNPRPAKPRPRTARPPPRHPTPSRAIPPATRTSCLRVSNRCPEFAPGCWALRRPPRAIRSAPWILAAPCPNWMACAHSHCS